ncbi:reverse transcriptase domain-containing protein [Tanacetum coccineum]
MHTRSSSNLIVESSTIPKRRNRRRSKQIVEPELRTIVETPVATMADTRTMSELLQAPTEGYGDAIVIPAILAENFELKVGLLQLVTSSQFYGFERDDPHAHIRWFNYITSTLKYKNVPHDAIKLMLFPFSLEGAARIWLEKEPPRSIHTWEDLVSKFVNYFFPPSKTTNLKNDITNFQQKFDETFSEAWDRFKDLIRKCPHHGFLELHQIDTFYNALTQSDQDSLNAAAGGNLLNRTPRDALTIIKNKSKVRTSRNKPIVSKVSTTTSSSSPSSNVTALTEIVKELVLMNKANQQASVKAVEDTLWKLEREVEYTTTSSSSPSLDVTALTAIVKELVLMNKANQQAFVKAVEEICVTCGGPHPYYGCLAIDSNTFNASAATGNYNQGGTGYRPQGDPNYRARNQMGPPGFPPPNVQNNQNYNRYNQNQGNYQAPNNQGRGQNFNQGNNNYQAPNFQAPNYQAQGGPSNELTNYMKSNEATLRAMQTQMTNMKTELRNEFRSSLDTRSNKIENQNNQIMNMLPNLTVQKQNPSGSGSLPSNIIANSRDDVKAITTRSGVAYDGPTIPPTPSPLPKEVEREIEATKDKVQTISSESTAHVQPLVVQVSIPEPEVAPKPNPKPSIPYPSRLNDQKLQEKANNQMLKFLQIFQRLLFNISFADALLHMPKFASTFKSLLIDYDVDPRVPLILGRPFLRTARALIDVHGEELTLRVNDEAITFKVRHTSRYSYKYDDESVNRIDFIDVTCEEYAQEVLGFLDSSKSSNPTPSLDPIITTSSPSLTPFEGGNFILEEIEACLTSDSIPPGIDDADFDLEGDIRLLEKLLNDDLSSPLPPKELNFEELKTIKSSIDDPPELELKDLPSHLEYAFLEDTNKVPVIIAKDLKNDEKARLLKDDFKPEVQHQRRVNLKIHEVIKKEVIKLLDAGLILWKPIRSP